MPNESISTPDSASYHRFTQVDQRQIILHQTLRQKFPGDQPSSGTLKQVSVITATNKLIYLEDIFANYLRQSYPLTELIIILNNNQLELADWKRYAQQLDRPDIRIYQLEESVTLGECLNYAVDQAEGDYIAKFDDDDYYAPNFLTDLVGCFSYTNAFVVGKAAQFIYFEKFDQLYLFNPLQSYRFNPVWGGTHLIKREVFDQVRFEAVNLAEDVHFNNRCTELGLHLYVADPFNYLRIRRVDKNLHTYQLEDNEYVQSGILLPKVEDVREYVSI